MNLYEIVLGTAIGDAYGAGVEFQDRNWIRKHVDFSSFVNVRHKIQVPEEKISVFTENYHDWEYTDDTEMTIGVLKALQSKEKFSEALLVQKWTEEYEKGKLEKGYGRNGHGSMRWYFSGEKTIEEIREFQKDRPNPGNAPAMRSVPLGLIKSDLINQYAEINANATHPNINAILSSQCIARATEFLIQKNGNVKDIIKYCFKTVSLNEEYKTYLRLIENLPDYNDLTNNDFVILCGKQPIEAPYFLSGIHGMPSDSKYTTGCVLYILKQSTDAFDALQKSIHLGGDVDSVASITTGIMAGIYGLESIPNYMIANVEGKNYFKKIAKNLKL
ncbi:ADP-ribosylglycohydrolase family protein [uncultured Tenacibaculum sp.]|uniref:ADP-ribosylglycohydrolase family protein n=1 Tax=uncultured Tenacibaculum sp. TaxID=174713 RepID=UPI002621D6A8|nr:ADP-ribosylglycohydrolase family protein [uncultured Tenacibaculum sp.]